MSSVTQKNQIRLAIAAGMCAFLLASCGQRVDNSATVSAIQSKLANTSNLNDYYVRVISHNGAVTLTGVVPNDSTKEEIETLSKSAGKMSTLVDNLTVAKLGGVPAVPDDAAIESSVRELLSGNPTLAQQNIKATSAGGVVVLSGNVANTSLRTYAEKLARQVSGVRDVVDKLLVAAATKSSSEPRRIPPPEVSLIVSPSLVTPGKSALLTWKSHNAKSLNLEPGIGNVRSEGSRSVNPRTSTTYTLVGVGKGGRTTATAHVSVWNAVPPPRISASANPAKIQKGQSTRLSWSSQDATSVDIEPSVGRVVATGSTLIAPTETTKYTVTATGQGGTQATTATVTVTAHPQPVVVTIPSGTTVEVQMIDSVGSASNQPNDLLRASLAAPIQVNRRLTLPQGTAVYLRALEIHPGERAGRVSEVRLVLDHLVYRGRSYSLHSNAFAVFGLSSHKRKSEEDGITRGRQVHIAPGARISFQLMQPVSIVLPPNDAQDH